MAFFPEPVTYFIVITIPKNLQESLLFSLFSRLHVPLKIKPIGITPKQRVMNQDLQKSDHWEIDKSDRIDSTEYMWSLIKPISIQKFQIGMTL